MFLKTSMIFILAILCFTLISANSLEEERNKKKYVLQKGSFQEKISTDNLKNYKISFNNVESLMNQCKSILTIFKNNPLIQESLGFNLSGKIEIPRIEDNNAFTSKKGWPIVMNVIFSTHHFYNSGKGKAKESKSFGDIYIRINAVKKIFDYMRIFLDGYGNDIYYQPKKVGEFYGFQKYHDANGMILINRSKKQLWVPVSSQEFIKILIQRTQDAKKKELEQFKGNVTPKEIYDSGKAERKKAFDEAYAMLKQHNPAEAEKAKKQFIEMEKQYENEAISHKENKDDLKKTVEQNFDALIQGYENEFKKMSPAGRKVQAYFVGESEEHPSGLGDPNDENAKPIVRINLDYFNDGLPQSAVRCVIIAFSVNGESFDRDKEDNLLDDFIIEHLYRTINWPSVFELLK